MLEGEYHSMLALHAVMASMIPKPYGWGKYPRSDPETYFFLCEFIEMSTTKLPDPKIFCPMLAKIHMESQSPNGQFGFHLPTNSGKLSQDTRWNDSWIEFVRQMIQRGLDVDREQNGRWEEMDRVASRLLSHVVPAVLGPLEENGRKVKPTLCHGDLWKGNLGTDVKTGKYYLFDAGSFYGHHEFDFAIWGRPAAWVREPGFVEEYLKANPPSEPKEMFGDRHKLYGVYWHLWGAAHWGEEERRK